MTDGMKIAAVAPWFGSKRNLAPEIVAELGPHAAYWEPFCGSLAVLMAKPVCPMETVCDLHGELINLARALAAEASAADLYGRMSRTLMHEGLFVEAAARYRERGNQPAGDQVDVPRAADFLYTSWIGRNGVTGTQSYNQGYAMRYTKNGGSAGKRWLSVVESIPAWHDRLRRVTILNRDAFGVLERLPDEAGVAVYCDPPYIAKGARYVHDFAAADHQRLAELLARFQRTRVVVSYYAHPELEPLYSGWTCLDKSRTKSLVSAACRDEENSARAPEVLFINGPSLTAPRQGGLFG